MQPFWSGSVTALLHTPSESILGALAEAQIRHHRTNEVQQLRAWEATIALLRPALAAIARSSAWHVLLEYPMLRLGKRADVVLLTDAAILVLEIKAGAHAVTRADREQVEDYALDLRDFHAASRRHPIVPILVATEARPRPATLPLLLEAVAPCSTPAPPRCPTCCAGSRRLRRRASSRSIRTPGSRHPTGRCRPSPKRRACSTRATAWPRSPPRALTRPT